MTLMILLFRYNSQVFHSHDTLTKVDPLSATLALPNGSQIKHILSNKDFYLTDFIFATRGLEESISPSLD